jgi:dTDP-4-dehydrorhamnose reductase
LGHDIARVAKTKGLDLISLSHEEIEVTDVDIMKQAFSKIRPGIVINSAAFHQVDRCEEDPAQAFQVNALGALNVARSANALRAKCVYVSTDYVFSGDKPPPKEGTTSATNSYIEADRPAPVNVYGVSKLAGEQLTLMAQPSALIVRVASLFGVAGARGKGGNFIEAILKKAREGGGVQVVSDQFMTPTYTMDAADAILGLVALNAGGVVHASNSGACSWYSFAVKAIELTGLKATVQPVSASTYPSKARRPANSALNNSHLGELLGRAQRSWKDGLEAYLSEKGYLP